MIRNQILHYKILEKLGEGGMGSVYRAKDTKLKRTVALKFLSKEFVENEEFKMRIYREAQTASALDHPNICTIFEINETDDEQLFISMAYYDGMTLDKRIESEIIESNEAMDIVIQIAKGLQAAHQKDIIHRDIKPANVIISKDGVAKILDFGIAKFKGETKFTNDNVSMGTIAYISPEQVNGEKIDHRTDIWSLGVLLYELLTRQIPFKGEYDQAIIYSILNESPTPIKEYTDSAPEKLISIIQKMLNKNPDERYQNMMDLIDELKTISSKQLTTGASNKGSSIAILPFTNMSDDKTNEY